MTVVVIVCVLCKQYAGMGHVISKRRNAALGWGDALGLIALLSLAWVLVVPAYGRLLLGCVFALAGASLFGRGRTELGAALIAIGVAVVVFGLPPPVGSWPFFFLLPIVGLCLAALVGRRSVLDLLGVQVGAFGRRELALIALFAIMSATALLLWSWFLQPDLSRVDALIPDVSIALLVPVGLGFAVLNAVIEEIVWRGVLLRWLRGIMPVNLAMLVQALSFGAAHWTGVPSGWVGVGLATIYGLMMGLLAVVARGLAASIVAHVVADLVIFSLILALA